MENVPLIILREMRGELMSTQVGESIPIPRVTSGYEIKLLIKVSLIGCSNFPMGKSVMRFARDNHFMVLGVVNSKSNS